MRSIFRGRSAGPRARRGAPPALAFSPALTFSPSLAFSQTLAAALITGGLLLAGCSSASTLAPADLDPAGPTASADPTGPTVAAVSHLGNLRRGNSLVATATAAAAEVDVRRSPDGPPRKSLPGTSESGTPLTLLVVAEKGDWLKVHLPTRPNGATGWVARDQVNLSTTPYRLVISMRAHRLDVVKDGKRVGQYPVGVGKSTTPTPPGEYYLTELIRPPDPDGAYGPYAFGLSAHSETLKKFAGGPGQLGLHGTNEPDRIGTDVSHGCLRLANDVITELAQTVPLGSPIEIQA